MLSQQINIPKIKTIPSEDEINGLEKNDLQHCWYKLRNHHSSDYHHKMTVVQTVKIGPKINTIHIYCSSNKMHYRSFFKFGFEHLHILKAF